MRDIFKKIGTGLLGTGGCLLYIALFIGTILLAVVLINWGAWLGEKVLPWLFPISSIALILTVVIFVPLAIFKKTRGMAAVAVFIASYVFGITLWFWGFLLTYYLWGPGALIIGIFLFGVGVIPIAMLATLFHKLWVVFGQLVLLTIITFGFRFLGVYLAEKHDSMKIDAPDYLEAEDLYYP